MRNLLVNYSELNTLYDKASNLSNIERKLMNLSKDIRSCDKEYIS